MKTLATGLAILAALVTQLHVGAAAAPVINAADLAKKIERILKRHSYPDASVSTWSGYIAKSAIQGSTDYDTLMTKLIAVFSSGDQDLDWLDWSHRQSELKIAAGQIAFLQFPDARAQKAVAAKGGSEDAKLSFLENIGPGKPEIGKAADTNDMWAQFSIWTGARISNPYTITGAGMITNRDSSTDGYIEFNLSSRYVLRQGTNASDLVWERFGTETPNDSHAHGVNPFAHLPDFDTRIGYVFRNKSASTNFNASTVVGTADFYADTSIGLPIFRFCSVDNAWKQQVSLELGGGFATDKDHLDLHPNAFVGLGWQGRWMTTGISPSTTNLQAYWIGRAGMAYIEQPIFVGASGTVAMDVLHQPRYQAKWNPSVGVVATYPLSSVVSLQASANAYFTDRTPASWNISLGVSLDMSTFFSSILGR